MTSYMARKSDYKKCRNKLNEVLKERESYIKQLKRMEVEHKHEIFTARIKASIITALFFTILMLIYGG